MHNTYHASSDTLFKMLLAAGLLHVGLLAGVTFTAEIARSTGASLDVTLVQHKSSRAPKEADFIAQANQEGSGTLDKKALISTTEMADFYDNTIREVQPIAQSTPQSKKQNSQDIISSFADSSQQSAIKQEEDKQDHESLNPSHNLSLKKQSLEIASLEAQLRDMRQAYAKKPRKKQLTAMSTQESKYAVYLDAWRIGIEKVGNIRYTDLDIQGLFGDVRLLVSIKKDGTLNEIRLLKSSGFAALDNAAIRIVRLASPFDSFPEQVRAESDILEIIRTWRFEKGRYSATN